MECKKPKKFKNALESAYDLGYSLETDIRFNLGQLVISHDVELKGSEEFLNSLNLKNTPVALNIKSDGLIHYVKS